MEQLRPELGFPFASTARQPLAAEIADLAAGSELRQLGQRAAQDGAAASAVMRRPERSADRMIDKRRARRGDCAHNVVRSADHQCGNAAALDYVSDETDGLMAERSVGNEQREIDARLRELAGQRRC
jgi:hypothetical protein